MMDLFPFTRSRLHDLPFMTPNYGEETRTPDLLRREMFRVVFGWEDDVRPLIRDESKSMHMTLEIAVLMYRSDEASSRFQPSSTPHQMAG